MTFQSVIARNLRLGNWVISYYFLWNSHNSNSSLNLFINNFKRYTDLTALHVSISPSFILLPGCLAWFPCLAFVRPCPWEGKKSYFFHFQYYTGSPFYTRMVWTGFVLTVVCLVVWFGGHIQRDLGVLVLSVFRGFSHPYSEFESGPSTLNEASGPWPGSLYFWAQSWSWNLTVGKFSVSENWPFLCLPHSSFSLFAKWKLNKLIWALPRVPCSLSLWSLGWESQFQPSHFRHQHLFQSDSGNFSSYGLALEKRMCVGSPGQSLLLTRLFFS